MNYEQLNEKLKDLRKIRYGKPVHTEVVNSINGGYSDQGEEGLSYEVYDIGLEDGLFLKLTITIDSYGDSEKISGIEFVRGKEKTITVYEF